MTAQDPRIKGWLESTITYLEMTGPPSRPPAVLPAPAGAAEVRRAYRPTISFYRYLYDTIGADWTWSGRRLMADEVLARIVQDPGVEVNVLWVDGVPAGLAELDRRSMPRIKLAYFGLIPDFVGKGFGGLLLNWAIDHAWSARPACLWLHTCDLDHPNALPLYQKAGFKTCDRKPGREAVLHGMTPPRRSGVPVAEPLLTSG